MSARLQSASGESVVVSRARVQIPAWGRWWADVDTQAALDLAVGEIVSLEIGGAVHVGAVVSGGATRAGRSAYRIVAGYGGWASDVSSQAYHDASGVLVSAVLSDAADAAGETVAGAPSSRVGAHYARSAGPASRVLHDLAPRGWYVDRDGVTQIGQRASVTYDGDATRVRVAPGAGVVDLATRDVGVLLPGVVVDGAEPATDVEYELTSDRLVVRVYAGTRSSRELDAFRRLLDSIDPRREYRCLYEYRVVTQSGEKLSLQAVRASSGMPDLEDVPVRMSAGVRASHQLGSLVTVAFLDGDPSRPRVVSGDDADAPGWDPSELELCDSALLGVARLNDPVLAGPWAGTITAASTKVKAG